MSYGTLQIEKMTTESGYSLGAGNASSFKNRIINGGMVIDQRNAGASYAQTNNTYNLDRWKGFSYAGGAVTGKYTVQQNAGSVTPPAGFTKYLGVTSSTATTTTADDIFGITQFIEGYNTADLNWGSANAKAITVSFWVRASVTGTYGVCFRNNAGDRAYSTTYAISNANTWEQKTITIAGDQSGTWATDSSSGIILIFQLQVGSNFYASPNSWVSGNYYGSSGCVSLLNTSGATFYITGVQFEVGTVATSFDFRSYGTELALCQRYYAKMGTGGSTYTGFGTGVIQGATLASVVMKYPVTMRASPTIAVSTTAIFDGSTVIAVTGINTQYGGTDSSNMDVLFASGGTANRVCTFVSSGSSGFVSLSSEL